MEMNSLTVYLKQHYKPGHIYIKQRCGLKATAALFSVRAQAEYPRKDPQTALLFRIRKKTPQTFHFLSKISKEMKTFCRKKKK